MSLTLIFVNGDTMPALFVNALFRALLTLILVLVLAFFMTHLAYQDPAVMLAPRNANQQTIDAIAHALRLNDPWYQQLWHYLYRGPEIQGAPIGLMHWPPALGFSFRFQMPVTTLILSKVPVTLSLALDITTQYVIVQLLAKLRDQSGLSILFISHDLGIVAALCDHILVLQNGHIVEQGSRDAVFYQPRHAYTRKLLDAIPGKPFPERQPLTGYSA